MCTQKDACRLIMQAPESAPFFLHGKAGMTVIVTDTDGYWQMTEVIWVEVGNRNPKVPTLYQDAYVDPGVINLAKAALVEHVIPRV